jgi:signal peptidase II
MNRVWSLSLLISTLIIVDQLSKGAIQSSFALGESVSIIDGFFNFTYVRNTGAAFGMGAGVAEIWRKILFLFLPVLVCVWIIVMFFKSLKGPFYMSLAYALIIAGAVGNLIDRFSLGYVVDFLDFYWKDSHFPAFNVADSAITVAGFLLAYDVLMSYKKTDSSKDKVDQVHDVK